MEKRGLLFAYQTKAALDSYDDTNQLLSDSFNEPATKLDTDAHPANGTGAQAREIAGGWYYEHDGHLRPDRLMLAWRKQLTSAGVRFVEGCELHELVGDGKVATCAETSGGTHAGRPILDWRLVQWTPKLDRVIGKHIPIEPGKGYSITMPRPACCPKTPLIFPEHRVAGHADAIRLPIGIDQGVRGL